MSRLERVAFRLHELGLVFRAQKYGKIILYASKMYIFVKLFIMMLNKLIYMLPIACLCHTVLWGGSSQSKSSLSTSRDWTP